MKTQYFFRIALFFAGFFYICFARTESRITSFSSAIFVSSSGVKVPYQILLPENYNPHKSYPMLIWLHGRGERGDDNTSQMNNGVEKFASSEIRKQFPGIVVVPQCPKNDEWTNMGSKYRAGEQKMSDQPSPIASASFELIAQLQKNIKQMLILPSLLAFQWEDLQLQIG